MLRSLYTASTGMRAQDLNVSVIANNLANVNTSGFKRSRAEFEDLLYQNLKIPGPISNFGNQIPTGIQLAQILTAFFKSIAFIHCEAAFLVHQYFYRRTDG